MPFSRLAIGSIFRATGSGVLDAVQEPEQELEPDAPIPDPRVYGPNYVSRATEETTDPETLYSPGSAPTHLPSSSGDHDWVDVGREAPIDFRYSHTPSAPSPVALPNVLPPEPETPLQPARASSIFRFVRRPKIFGPAPSEHRSTFPLRDRLATDTGGGSGRSEEVPPHLRVQRAPPFVRPLTGLNHDELGAVYSEIRSWRTRLKTVNEDIRIAQEDGYQAIADGAFVKGWLLTGRGLRFLPGIQLIEGRAKEDVRWDILQLDGKDRMSQVAFWTVVVVIGVALLFGSERLFISLPACELICISDCGCGIGRRSVARFRPLSPVLPVSSEQQRPADGPGHGSRTIRRCHTFYTARNPGHPP
jgi:calcium permeable stress-gated cation channel